MKIQDLSISAKLYGSFFIVILVFGIMSGFQMFQMSRMSSLDAETERMADQVKMIMRTKETADMFGLMITEGIISGNVQETMTEYEKYKAEIKKGNEDLKKSAETDAEKVYAEEIEKGFTAWQAIFEGRIIPELRKSANNSRIAIGLYESEIHPLLNKVERNLELYESSIDRESKAAFAAFDRAYLLAIRVTLAVVVAGIAFGAVFAFIITRYIKKRLSEVVDLSGKLSEGDLTGRIASQQGDEFGTVSKSLNSSLDSLEKLMSEVMVGMQNLAQAVEQISSGNQNLSQRTSEQASSLEEIASTIEEATAAINQNAENASRARELTESGAKISIEGNKIAIQAVESITNMNESSKRVSDIIAVINEIAFQTNLLALNAAVEAARAGEQGRGFAVVAGEVRNLAQRSGNAAREIETLIKDTVNKVSTGTELVNRTGTALNEIAEAAKTSAQIITEIAASSLQQKQGVGQINNAIAEMDSMTQQNASLVEETASASEEMANQATELLEMIQRFRINKDLKGVVFENKHKEIHLRAAESAKRNGGNGNGRNKKPAHAPQPGTAEIMQTEGFEQF